LAEDVLIANPMNRRLLAVGLMFGLLGCSSAPSPEGTEATEGTPGTIDTERDEAELAEVKLRHDDRYDALFTKAGAEFRVPAVLLKAIAFTETRYEMVTGEVENEGQLPRFGMMALEGERLTKGAELAKVGEADAKVDPEANVRAAAALLASYAGDIQRDDLAAWATAVGKFSGLEVADAKKSYVRDEVYANLNLGLGKLGEGMTAELPEEMTLQALPVAPDYPGGVWRASPNFGARSTKVKMVIIHTCESGYSGCWSWLTQTRSGVSAHYVVREDGKEVSQLVRESQRAWHIGATYACKNNDGQECGLNGTQSNHFTVGIEHGGYARQKTWPAGQIDASAKLTCDITRSQGIPRDRFHIVGHGKLQPYDRTDPGPNWPWADYLARVNKHCGATPPPPPPPGGGGEIVIDSNNARNDRAKGYVTVSDNWVSSTNVTGFYGTGYYVASAQPVSDGAVFSFYLPANATKTIDAHWAAASDRSAGAPFVAINSRGERVGAANLDQRVNGGRWNQVGSFAFTAGWNKIVVSRWTTPGTYVVADAVRVR
jgi:hypothetical protein